MRKAKSIYSGFAIARKPLAWILADSKAAKEWESEKIKRKGFRCAVIRETFGVGRLEWGIC